MNKITENVLAILAAIFLVIGASTFGQAIFLGKIDLLGLVMLVIGIVLTVIWYDKKGLNELM